MPKHKILIVDDEKQIQSSISLLLKMEGYTVDAAENGEEALTKIIQCHKGHAPFALILLDIQMPVLNGIELIDELKARDINIPILVISGYGNKSLIMDLLKRNCTEYLDKPFGDKTLMDRIQIILNKTPKMHNINAIINSERIQNLINQLGESKARLIHLNEQLNTFFSQEKNDLITRFKHNVQEHLGLNEDLIKRINELDAYINHYTKGIKAAEEMDSNISKGG